MLTYNMDVTPESLWKRTTPSEAELTQPYYCTEAGVFYAQQHFSTARTDKESYLLFYTLRGAGLIEQGESHVELRTGQALLLNCRTPQSYCTAPGQSCWHHYWVHLDGAGVAAMEPLLLPGKKLTPVQLTGVKIQEFFETVLAQMERSTVDSMMQIGLALHGMLALCARSILAQAEATSARQVILQAAETLDNQREESIEGQIRECTAYAEKNGITIVKHYIDRAISAKTDNRPEFQQMIKDSDKKLFDIVLVWKLDRFARNRYDSARYKTQLKKNGVKLMSATEVISEGPEGIILESVLEGYAEYYSADLSEKVIRGMTENALKGKFTGGAIPFGYIINADHRFEIDPLTAPFVAETFQRYNDGQTMREIRDWLNEKGVKNQRGGLMTFNTIQHMLNNRRYIRELKYRDVLIPDAILSIVSAELFNDVQEKMLKNKKAPARRKAEDDSLLTTKLFCGYCGALMFGESGTSRTGEVHRYYKCATAKKHKGCKKKTVRKQWLEDLVVNQTMQLVKDDAAMESIIAKVMELQNKENTNIPLYEKQLRDAESGIQNMLNAIQAGILTSSTKERLEQLEETKRELEARIAEEKLAKPKVTEEFIRFWLRRFRKLDMSLKDQRQALVDTFINAIYLYDDKVLITFNYKEGTQTVTFGEATEVASEGNGSDLDCIPAPQKKTAIKSCLFLFYMTISLWLQRRITGLEQHCNAAGGATCRNVYQEDCH
ncbi:MAG: recombinase family protein [Faecalibacterium sp.]